MRHLGSYNGFECYEVSSVRELPVDEECIYILGTNGAMYFGGTQVGKVNLNGYKVLEFDLEIYKRKKKREEENRKRTEIPVPACVADCTSTTSAVGEELDLCGTDEFFARVALDIDQTLKSAGKFNGN